jgi:RNA recognition motif-containing protein
MASLVDSIFGRAEGRHRADEESGAGAGGGKTAPNKSHRKRRAPQSEDSGEGGGGGDSDPGKRRRAADSRLSALFGSPLAAAAAAAATATRVISSAGGPPAAAAATASSSARQGEDGARDPASAGSEEGPRDQKRDGGRPARAKNDDDDDRRDHDGGRKRKGPLKDQDRDGEDDEGDGGSDREQVAQAEDGGGGGDDGGDDAEERTVFVGNLPLGSTRRTLEQLFRGCCYPDGEGSNDSSHLNSGSAVTEPHHSQPPQAPDAKIVSARIRCVPTAGVKLPPHLAGNQGLVRKVCANTGRLLESGERSSSSCVGYVVFSRPLAAERALRLNNAVIPDNPAFAPPAAKGAAAASTRHLRVDRVRPEHDASRSVFVGNLPYRTDEETLRRHVLRTCFSFAAGGDEREGGGGQEEGDGPVEAVRVVRDADNHHRCRGFAYLLMKDRAKVPDVLRLLPKSTYLGRELRVQVCGRNVKNRRGEKATAGGDGGGGARDRRRASSGHQRDAPAKKKPRHVARDGGGPSSSPSSPSPRGIESATGALRRILAAEAARSGKAKTKRARGPLPSASASSPAPRQKSGGGRARAAGASKRSAAQAKTQSRVKKIQKRIDRGMGKNKK